MKYKTKGIGWCVAALLSLLLVGLFATGCQQEETPAVPTHTPIAEVTLTGTSDLTLPDSGPTRPTRVPTRRPTRAPTRAATVTPVPAPSDTPAPPSPGSATGLLFGPFHLPGDMFGTSPFTGAFVALRPETALDTLEAARQAGVHLVIQLAGGRRGYQAAGGAFDLGQFKQRLDEYRGIDFGPYVADGTIVGHLMFDEPQDPSNWNRAPVPFADIDAAAAYSHELWPTMPVGIGGPSSFLQAGAPYSSLDFAFAQYTTRNRDPVAWLDQEVKAAQASGLGLLLSINVLHGNSRVNVSAAQLDQWGRLFLSEPYACGVLMWKYDEQDNGSYFRNQAVADTAAALAQLAREQPFRSCQP